MADTRMLAVVVMTIMVVSMTVDAVYHKEQQREEVILHVDQQALDQEGTTFKNPEPATGLQESPTPNKRIGEEVIVDQEGLNTFVRIISLLPIPSYLQMRTIRTDFNVSSRIPRVIRFADCSSSCEDTPQIVAYPFINQDGVTKYRVQKKWLIPVANVRRRRMRCLRRKSWRKYRKPKMRQG